MASSSYTSTANWTFHHYALLQHRICLHPCDIQNHYNSSGPSGIQGKERWREAVDLHEKLCDLYYLSLVVLNHKDSETWNDDQQKQELQKKLWDDAIEGSTKQLRTLNNSSTCVGDFLYTAAAFMVLFYFSSPDNRESCVAILIRIETILFVNRVVTLLNLQLTNLSIGIELR